MYTHNFNSWWNASHYANAFHNAYSGEAGSIYLSRAGYSWTLNTKHSLSLPWEMRSEILGYYNAPVLQGIRKKAKTYGLDIALEKKLWKEKAMVKIAANGLIRNAKPGFTSTNADLVVVYQEFPDNRKVQLSLSYRFGS